MTTNPIILKLIECLEYVVEKDKSDELEFNLEINGASLEEQDEEEWDDPELSDFECITSMEMSTNSEHYLHDRGFDPAHLKELLDLLRSAAVNVAAS